MKRIAFYLSLALLAFSPLATQAATIDLGFPTDRAVFFNDSLISGKTIRLYASVKNFGTIDAQGAVRFYQGNTLVGQSQVVSVRAGGMPDEVYVDFVVPNGSFNIRVQLVDVTPADEYLDNNVSVTPLFEPILDTDSDGISDDRDNCKNVSNPNQSDQDGDGVGDACDGDTDGDGIANTVDNCSNVANANQANLDKDNLGDACDPTDDRPKVVPPAPKPVAVPTIKTEPKVEPATTKTEPVRAPTDSKPVTPVVAVSTTYEPEREGVELGGFVLSPKTTFSYERKAWNRYNFKALSYEEPNLKYKWDFGDGSTEEKGMVSHTFKASGDYQVRLEVTNERGEVASDQVILSISFFNFSNWKFAALLGSLGSFLFLLVMLLGKLKDEPEENE